MANQHIASEGQPSNQEVLSCVACGRGLTDIPRTARFCPDCGAILYRIANRFIVDENSPAVAQGIWTKVRRLCRFLDQNNRQFSDRHSRKAIFLVREGYASAMLQMGWRYETGRGAARNAQEASRCYFKSALLGNAAARERLAPYREGPMEIGSEDTGGDASDFLTG